LRRRCWPTVVMLLVRQCMKHGSACAFINQEVRRLARYSCQRPNWESIIRQKSKYLPPSLAG
jgi:hypothetical protein